mgnify:CR=1 FL=1
MASWNKLNYPKRLFVWLLGYSLLLVGCFVIFQYHREKEFKSAELNARLQGINAEILSGLAHGDTIVSCVAGFPDLRISVINADGTVVFDNLLDKMPSGNHLHREEIKEALATGEGFTVRRHSESTGETYFYSATRGDDGEIVRTAVPYSVSLGELLQADFSFIRIMGAVTLVMCILGYIATRRVGQHILRLNLFAEKAERGEKIYHTEPFPNDELGSISNHIVRLYASLQQAIADRDAQHRAAIHEQKEKERIKKQLTNNINHELKTPVASIEVCVESLIDHPEMSEAKRRDFLARCLSNVERLKRLLNDVSLITRMDDGPASIAKENLDLADIIAEVVDDSLPAAERKNISICNKVQNSIMVVGNRSLLASVFQNLIDNAVAYSGGNRIDISAKHLNRQTIAIEFRDNGCGIPDEHLPRIFERFYRIDKGRSRAAGGTGLGLAIVKNAILLHGGSITAANGPDGGLLFNISLPVESDPA